MKKWLILGLSLFTAALLIVIFLFYYWVYIPPSDLRSTINEAKYPNSLTWNTSYSSGIPDGLPTIKVCFDSQDSKNTIFNYYETYFTNKGWSVKKENLGSDETLSISKSDVAYYRGIVGDSTSSTCKFYINISKN